MGDGQLSKTETDMTVVGYTNGFSGDVNDYLTPIPLQIALHNNPGISSADRAALVAKEIALARQRVVNVTYGIMADARALRLGISVETARAQIENEGALS
jgi:hypothetical protein